MDKLIMAGPLGFSVAWDAKRGDRVVYAGAVRIIEDVDHEGKDSPYFWLSGVGRVSWQICRAAPEPAPLGWDHV